MRAKARGRWDALLASPVLPTVLAVLLGAGILLYSASHVARHQIMDDRFYLDALERQFVYGRIYEEILADPALADVVDPLLGNVSVVRSLLVSTLRLVLPPETIRSGVELAAAEWELYLSGEREVWQPRIDLRGIDANIAPFISSYVAARVAVATGLEVGSAAEFRDRLESLLVRLMEGEVPIVVPRLEPQSRADADALAELMLSRVPVPVPQETHDQIAAAFMVGNVQEALALAAPFYVDRSLRDAARQWREQLDSGFILNAIESFEAMALQHSGAVTQRLVPVRSAIRLVAIPLGIAATAAMLGAMAGLLWILPLQGRSRRRWLGVTLLVTGAVGGIAWTLALAGFNQAVTDFLSRLPSSFPPSLITVLGDVSGELSRGIRDATAPALFLLLVAGAAALSVRWAIERADVSIRLLERYRSQAAASVVGTTALLGILLGSEVVYAPTGANGEIRCNGHRELCDRRVNEVVFAGTHNSMSAASLGWVFPHHDRAIASQLAAGYRAFLLDTHYWGSREAIRPFREQFPERHRDSLRQFLARVDPPRPGPFLCHGVCGLGATPLAEALATIARFMRQNPHEVVILSFEDYVTPGDTHEAFRASGLLPLVYMPEENGPWPTLRQLIERNERVIVLADHDGGEPPWYLPFWTNFQDTPFNVRRPSQFSCGTNRGYEDAPMLMINHWIATLPPDRVDAFRVNRYDVIMEHVEQCREERGMEPTIIAVDFYSIGDTRRVVDDLNLRRHD